MHTKGKWKLSKSKHWSPRNSEPKGLHLWGDIKENDGRTGVRLATIEKLRGFRRSETEANARLIAAAPDLLEACKEALSRLTMIHDVHNIRSSKEIGQLEQVIAKAEGSDK